MHRSVFAKLVAIMLAMATSLLLLVSIFFALVMFPALRAPSNLSSDYARLFAATQPGHDEAKRVSEQFAIDVRYEGPKGTWATADDLPPVANAHDEHRRYGYDYTVLPAPDGGSYVFRWTQYRRLIIAHDAMLVLLLVLMIAVLVIAHVVLRRLLRPLRTLGDGVARLSEGELDVVLPNPTRDEFGALTDAFNAMVGRVRGMIDARDQLLLDVSHELRSPVTRLRVALELLPEDNTRRHMTADVAEMEAMIAELLELERLRDGRLRLAPHDLAELVRDVAADFPRVRVVAAESVANVDADKMRTVIRNLLENATKYGGPNVKVHVSPGEIRVTDDGPGIPAADLPNLFEPFFRVNRSRSKSPAGYGLGLSICKRIVEAHGGTITVTNNPTTFTVNV
ncbi:MAG TPA: ATP-binding protein [Thermoanaerobaculia bacterium]|jgi:signal transduction histidine kinase